MDGSSLQNLISKGWGTAARRIGMPCKVYRPTQIANPLSSRYRVFKLNCSFAPLAGFAVGTSGYNGQLWRGTFDSAYTMPGDYLQTPRLIYFIGSQIVLQPIICVQTNSVISIERPQPAQMGNYSAFNAETSHLVISEWPALLYACFVQNSGHFAGSTIRRVVMFSASVARFPLRGGYIERRYRTPVRHRFRAGYDAGVAFRHEAIGRVACCDIIHP